VGKKSKRTLLLQLQKEKDVSRHPLAGKEEEKRRRIELASGKESDWKGKKSPSGKRSSSPGGKKRAVFNQGEETEDKRREDLNYS